MRCGLKGIRRNMNNEIDNDFTSGSKINVTLFFFLVSLFVYKITQFVRLNLFVHKRTQFVQLAGI